jgi:hypothetical protein
VQNPVAGLNHNPIAPDLQHKRLLAPPNHDVANHERQQRHRIFSASVSKISAPIAMKISPIIVSILRN